VTTRLILPGLVLLAACSDAGGDGGAQRPPICATLETYVPSTTTPLSFEIDIQPIMANSFTCGLALACHGDPPVFLDPGNSRTLKLVGDPAAARTALRGMSVNAPTKANVVPGQVGQSFVAYKLSGAAGLSCVASTCVAGASVGTAMPCGDTMPSTGGTLTDADRIKILDWIAQGAAE
jgi:hypothetical protein